MADFSAEFPIFVLAFALVAKADYIDKLVPSLQRLKMDFFGHDQVILHERDIRRQLPPFGVFRTDAGLRLAFLERLNDVVAAAPVELYCSVVKKVEHRAKYADPWNPYEIALLFCMEQLRARLLSLGQEGRRVDVIFESRGKAEDDALELEFHRITTNQRWWGWKRDDFTTIEWAPHFIPKSANSSGMQVADLAARPIGLHTLRPTQANRAFDALRSKLKACKTFP